MGNQRVILAHLAVQENNLLPDPFTFFDGKRKVQTKEDWEARRPRFEAIAPAIVEAVRRAMNVAIPLPSVTVKAADWLTRDEVAALVWASADAAPR